MRTSFITWYPSCRRSDALAKGSAGFRISSITLLSSSLSKRLSNTYFRREILSVIAKGQSAIHLSRYAACVRCAAGLVVLPVSTATRFIIDAHTGIFDDPRWTWLKPLSRFLARRAETTIVTNSFLQREVENWGAKAIIIGDVPVDFPEVEPAALGPGFHVVVINTFSQDEPLNEILAATKELSEVQFHVTGNPKHSRIQYLEPLPANVRLTGWLTDDEYAALLRAADTVMCLTTHDHTMQRGAYEAMALDKPLITSNWELLRKTFYNGTIHVDAAVKDIARAVNQARRERDDLARGMQQLRRERLDIFATNLQALQKIST